MSGTSASSPGRICSVTSVGLAAEGRIVQVDDGDLRAGLYPEFVEEGSSRGDVRAHFGPSPSPPPRTAPKTMTPSNQPPYAPATASTMTGIGLPTRLESKPPRPARATKTNAPATPPATAPTRDGAVLPGLRPRSPAGP